MNSTRKNTKSSSDHSIKDLADLLAGAFLRLHGHQSTQLTAEQQKVRLLYEASQSGYTTPHLEKHSP